MTVIAKMNVESVREFGAASLIKLRCVYENDGLNGEKYEDRRFTTATPWGEGDLTTPHVKFEQGQMLYLVFVSSEVSDRFAKRPDCLASMFVRCKYIEPWPGTKQIEFVRWRGDGEWAELALNLRLAIDNEHASSQFVEGETYFLTLYDAAKTTLAEAVAGA